MLSFRCQHKMSPLPIYEVPHKSTHWPMAHENPTTAKHINSPTYKFKNLSTHGFTSSSTHDHINSQANSSQAHQLTNLSTHKLIHSRVHPFISSATHELSNPPKIKFLSFSLQYRSNFRSILAYFFKPNYLLLAPQMPLFNDYFAFFSHIFHGSKRFYLYHFCGYLCLSTCI